MVKNIGMLTFFMSSVRKESLKKIEFFIEAYFSKPWLLFRDKRKSYEIRALQHIDFTKIFCW